MIKRRTQKQTYTRPSWTTGSKYLLPVVFVIAFAGVGVSLLYGSHAQTPCTKQTLRDGAMNNCVLQVQQILDTTASHWGGTFVLQDSVFNTQTETQVEKFQDTQTAQLNLFTNGVDSGTVTQSTWRALCYADNIWQGSESAFNDAGCQVVFGVSWGGPYSAIPWTD